MTEASPIDEPTATGEPASAIARGPCLPALEVDTRLLGMVVALAVLWVAFNILSDGLFLSPRNLWNLSVQSAAVADHDDRHGADHRVAQHRPVDRIDPRLHRDGHGPAPGGVDTRRPRARASNQPSIWIIVVIVGIALGALIGGLQGFVIAYVGIPSFIVTLGGLLIWRGAAFALASGRTIAPLDPTFQLLGGGPEGSLGETLSWVVAGIAIVAHRRTAWSPTAGAGAGTASRCARCGRTSRSGSSASLLVAARRHGSRTPTRGRRPSPSEYAIEHGIPIPPGGLIIPTGIANPGPHRDRHRRAHDVPRARVAGSDATSTPSAATRRPPSWPASTRAGRS